MVMYCSSAKACNVQLLVTITCYACTSLNLLLHAESMEVILAPNLPHLAPTNVRYSSIPLYACRLLKTTLILELIIILLVLTDEICVIVAIFADFMDSL